jgi:hypothetical protein
LKEKIGYQEIYEIEPEGENREFIFIGNQYDFIKYRDWKLYIERIHSGIYISRNYIIQFKRVVLLDPLA